MRYETSRLSGLDLSAHVERGEAFLRLGGRLNVRDVDALESALSRIVVRRPHRVVIDLSDLESVAAMGIGSLNTFCRALTRAGGRVVLQNPCPDVAGRLRECGLGSAIEEHFHQDLPFAEFLTRASEQGLQDITIGRLLDFLVTNLRNAGEVGR